MNQRPDDVNGVLLQQTINKYLDTMHAYEKLYPKQGISELHTRVQKNLNTTAEVKMSDSEEVATSSMLRGAYFNYASYIMLVHHHTADRFNDAFLFQRGDHQAESDCSGITKSYEPAAGVL